MMEEQQTPAGSKREVICVIPARGGSKGIPLKNLQVVGEYSLIARTIRASLAADSVNRVVVSTDHADIEAEARAHGAQVVVRPDDLSGDSVDSESAVRHVVDSLELTDESKDAIVLLAQATSPFTSPNDFESAISPILEGSADSTFTAVLGHPFSWSLNAHGFLEPINHDHKRRLPRQEIAPTWVETGAIYATRLILFMKSNSRFNGRISPIEIEPERGLEIDSWDELELARRMTWLH